MFIQSTRPTILRRGIGVLDKPLHVICYKQWPKSVNYLHKLREMKFDPKCIRERTANKLSFLMNRCSHSDRSTASGSDSKERTVSFLSSEKHNRINLTGVFWQQRGGNQSGFGSQGETTSFTWRKKRSSHTASVRLLERGNEKLKHVR